MCVKAILLIINRYLPDVILDLVPKELRPIYGKQLL